MSITNEFIYQSMHSKPTRFIYAHPKTHVSRVDYLDDFLTSPLGEVYWEYPLRNSKSTHWDSGTRLSPNIYHNRRKDVLVGMAVTVTVAASNVSTRLARIL